MNEKSSPQPSLPLESPPPDAVLRYKDYGNGEMVWVKDIDDKNPNWVLARVWSTRKKRWRSARERIFTNRLGPLTTEEIPK